MVSRSAPSKGVDVNLYYRIILSIVNWRLRRAYCRCCRRLHQLSPINNERASALSDIVAPLSQDGGDYEFIHEWSDTLYEMGNILAYQSLDRDLMSIRRWAARLCAPISDRIYGSM